MSSADDTEKFQFELPPKQEECLDLCLKILCTTGFLGGDKHRKRSKFETLKAVFPRFMLGYQLFILYIISVDSYCKIGNIKALAGSLFVLIVQSIAIVKNYMLIYEMDSIIRLCNFLEKINRTHHFHDLNQDEIFNRYKRESHRFTRITLIAQTVGGVIFCVGPALQSLGKEVRKLPHEGWFPFETLHSPYYELAYFIQAFAATTNGFFIGLCNIVFISMLINLIGQFKILQHKLQNVCEDSLKMYKEEQRKFEEAAVELGKEKHVLLHAKPSHYIYGKSAKIHCEVEGFGDKYNYSHRYARFQSNAADKIKPKCILPPKNGTHNDSIVSQEDHLRKCLLECIQNQRSLFDFVNELGALFGLIIILECFVGSALICVLAFEIKVSNNIDDTLKWSYLLVLATVQFFVHCWYATVLALESQATMDAIYFSDWIERTTEFKWIMQMIILRSSRQSQLIAARFLPLTLEFFLKVMHRAYTIYALITSLHKE